MATQSAASVIARSAPAIRAALAELAPEECAQFEAEFHTAMAEADDDFDTTRVDLLIGRWWARAIVLADPDPVADASWERIKAGDTTDVVAEWRAQPDGSHRVYHPAPAGGWAFSHVRPAEQG